MFNSFNYCAFMLLVITLITTYSRKMTRGIVNKICLNFSWLVLLSNVVDITYTYMMIDKLKIDTPMYDLIYNSIYTFDEMLYLHIAFYFGIFIITIIGKWDRIEGMRRKIMAIPFALQLIILFINIKFGFLHEVIDGEIIRKPLSYLVYLPSLYYFLLGFFYLIKNKNEFKQTQFISLITLFPIMTASVMTQIMNPLIRVDSFMLSICILIVTMAVIKPEEIIDDISTLRKISAYAVDMKQNFKYKRQATVIMLNIVNSETLQNVMGYDRTTIFRKNIANTILQVRDKIKLSSDVYYLGVGKYRVVTYEKNPQKTIHLANEMNRIFSTHFEIDGQEIGLIPCICLVRCPEDIDDFPSLMNFGAEFHKRVDYDKKVFYAKDIFDKKRYDVLQNIDAIIENALLEKKFEVYYQPIYSIADKKFNSAEALIRLKTEEFGFISPELFIPCAEKSGAIYKIGEFVLNEVCKFISSEEFEKLGIEYIEVNLSVAQCMQSTMSDEIMSIINKHNIPPSKINLELTETAASQCTDNLVENVLKLSKSGISFSLDDYGTGYSNMERVVMFPFKIVKLDKTFAIQSNEKMQTVLVNTIKMLKDLGVKIVVEGVETEDVLKQFAGYECEFIQGYYFSKPLPKKEFIEYIETFEKEKIMA